MPVTLFGKRSPAFQYRSFKSRLEFKTRIAVVELYQGEIPSVASQKSFIATRACWRRMFLSKGVIIWLLYPLRDLPLHVTVNNAAGRKYRTEKRRNRFFGRKHETTTVRPTREQSAAGGTNVGTVAHARCVQTFKRPLSSARRALSVTRDEIFHRFRLFASWNSPTLTFGWYTSAAVK